MFSFPVSILDDYPFPWQKERFAKLIFCVVKLWIFSGFFNIFCHSIFLTIKRRGWGWVWFLNMHFLIVHYSIKSFMAWTYNIYLGGGGRSSLKHKQKKNTVPFWNLRKYQDLTKHIYTIFLEFPVLLITKTNQENSLYKKNCNQTYRFKFKKMRCLKLGEAIIDLFNDWAVTKVKCNILHKSLDRNGIFYEKKNIFFL